MQVHRFEKVWLGAALLLIVGFIATIAYGSVGVGVGMVDDSGGQISAEAVQNGNTGTQFDDPGVVQTGEISTPCTSSPGSSSSFQEAVTIRFRCQQVPT